MDDGSRCLRLKAKLSNYILIDEESRDTICIVNFWWCKSLRKCIFNNIQNGLKSYALILQKLTIILSITQLRIFFQNMAFHVLNRLWLNCVTLEIALDDWLNISRFKVHPRSTFSALQEHQSECMNKNHCLYFIRQYLYFEFFADAYYDMSLSLPLALVSNIFLNNSHTTSFIMTFLTSNSLFSDEIYCTECLLRFNSMNAEITNDIQESLAQYAQWTRVGNQLESLHDDNI